MLSIAVNHTPVAGDVPPVVVRGHVLLPARAVFTALGAEIDYDPRTRQLDIRRGTRFVRVTLDSRNARIGDKPVKLEVAPQIYRGRTMLPLRFVAEALGGSVLYDRAARIVRIADAEAPLVLPHTPALAYGPPTVEFRRPAPGEYVTGPFPAISAEVETHGGPPVDPNSVRVFLDGRDVSDEIYHSGDAVAFTPRHEVLAGAHEVTVQGADTDGRRFTANWTFESTFAFAPQPPQVLGYQAPALSVLGPTIYGFGSSLQFVLLGPPGGYGYVNLCGYGSQYPLAVGNDQGRYYSFVSLPSGIFAPACYVSGYLYQPNGYVNYFSLNQPLQIDTRVPSASPSPRPLPPIWRDRRPLPSPSPVRPSPSAQPHLSPPPTAPPRKPLPHPTPRPALTP